MQKPYNISKLDNPQEIARLDNLLTLLFRFTDTAGVFISSTAPNSPYNGQIWCKTGADTDIMMRYYSTADSSWHALMTGGVVT